MRLAGRGANHALIPGEGLPYDIQPIENIYEPCRARTCDPLIKSQLLYQLS